ncbi:hypothetical protein PISMIDRAFT_15261 [Pisolithus microcarpus 441]|uniref:DUF6532 domain-containing protein n=1 Tax=Pisolithus microcarpus 441 TaxID=765257 RepID=A0A0C9ZBG4_9AGAM|nr:hypothetical protein BKA83DRAFT_15261 [Pisolithus microcarpus]KIK17263.1 hypothetical protein PISMIDRAFT_15261 [Pisolithus microcarpus 441]
MPSKQHPKAQGKTAAAETVAHSCHHSGCNPLPSIPETCPPMDPTDVQDDDSAAHTNAGTGGQLEQLEKVSQAIETPFQRREQAVNLPDNEPVNAMAPTPHCLRKKKAPNTLACANLEGLTTVPASARDNNVVEPAQISVQAEQGGHFGFQLRDPPHPTYIGSQSLDTFQGHQTNSSVTTKQGGQCQEVLMEVIAHFEAQGWEVKAGYYPTHKLDMCRLLFNDILTFCSNLKKVAIKSLHADYDLYPPTTAKMEEQCIAAVKKKANDLLSMVRYLCGEPDSQIAGQSKQLHPQGS